MTLTTMERKLMEAVRPLQLERRKAQTSWSEVASVNRSVGPTLDITFDKLDEFIPVERWRSGNPDLGQAEIVTDTGSIKAYFYGSEYKIPFWENWLRENAVGQPNASVFEGSLGSERFNLQRMMRRLAGQIEREIDNDFYAGNAKIDFPGMTTLDATPTTLTNDLTTQAGRKEFVQAVVDLNQDGSRELQAGNRVLAIDHSAMGYLALPYEDTGETGVPVMDVLSRFIDRIVPVQNSNMQDTAFLHWEDPENVEVFDMTPAGVQILAGEPRRGEDLKVKMFHMWTAKEYRADTVKEIDGLLP